jgi:Protein of unknown function (DUF2809)
MRAAYAALGALTIPAGLLIRFAPLGLPPFIVKYGGSTLWAVMVYWTLAFLLPKTTLALLASVAGIISTLVELQRLYHGAWLDAFRVSLAGVLLLGRFFSLWDILAYWLAILAAALLDHRIIRPLLQPRQR